MAQKEHSLSEDQQKEMQDTRSANASRNGQDDLFKRLCLSLYAYQFGTIGFLELLDQFEEALGIEPSPKGRDENRVDMHQAMMASSTLPPGASEQKTRIGERQPDMLDS